MNWYLLFVIVSLGLFNIIKSGPKQMINATKSGVRRKPAKSKAKNQMMEPHRSYITVLTIPKIYQPWIKLIIYWGKYHRISAIVTIILMPLTATKCLILCDYYSWWLEFSETVLLCTLLFLYSMSAISIIFV